MICLCVTGWSITAYLIYIVLTKTDKLSNNQTIARQRAIERTLRVSAGKKPILFSAITQKGKSDIWQFLENHLSSLPA